MSITIDPTVPANTENIGGGLGASRIRNIATWLQEMFGGAGVGPVTFGVAPFIVDTGTGLSTVPSNPTAALGIVPKQYVDNNTFLHVATTTSIADAYSVTNTVPFTSLTNNMVQVVRWNSVNSTTSPTLNVDSLGAVAITTPAGGTIQANSLIVGLLNILLYNSGTNSWNIVGQIQLRGDLTGSYAAPSVTGWNAVPLDIATNQPPTTTGQIYSFNSGTSKWTVGSQLVTTDGGTVTSLSNSSVPNNGSNVIFSLSSTAPSNGTAWRPIVEYSVFYASHTAATCFLTCALTSSPDLYGTIGTGTGSLNTGSAHTVSCNGVLIGHSTTTPGTSVTFTLTGFAVGQQADLVTVSDSTATAVASMHVIWIPN